MRPLLLLALALPSHAAAFDCKATVAAIDAKFGLASTLVDERRCEVHFGYVPSEPVVPPSSYFAKWNEGFSLGEARGEEELLSLLRFTR